MGVMEEANGSKNCESVRTLFIGPTHPQLRFSRLDPHGRYNPQTLAASFELASSADFHYSGA